MAGLEAYGAWWLLLELIAVNMEGDKIDCTCLRLPESLWSRHFGISAKKFRKYVDFMKNLGLIILEDDPPYVTIDVPNLLKYRDEWTTRKSARTRVTPEPLPSGSVCSDVMCSSSLSSSSLSEDAKQIDINGVPPVKKAAKEAKRKGAKKADPKKPDYIDQIIGVCSVIRFSYRRSCIHPNGKMRSQASEVLEFCKAQWGLLHSKHGWPEISSANILKYISLLYEAFMLEDETTGPDTDFARGCNFAFGAFRARIQKYAEMVANTNDSYGNPVFVPLDEPEDVLRYDPGCSHESLVRIEAFKQRRLKDGKLISRYVTASAPPHEKRWREERERIARGEPRSVTVEGDGNGKK